MSPGEIPACLFLEKKLLEKHWLLLKSHVDEAIDCFHYSIITPKGFDFFVVTTSSDDSDITEENNQGNDGDQGPEWY